MKQYSLLLVLTLLSSCSQYIPIAGGALEGEVGTAPMNWSEIASANIIQLETNPNEPYSVNLWVIGEGKRLMVFAGDNHSTWVENIEANPDIKIKINNIIYALTAKRITNAETFEWFASAWQVKYGNRPNNENVNETYLMQLSPRNLSSRKP